MDKSFQAGAEKMCQLKQTLTLRSILTSSNVKEMVKQSLTYAQSQTGLTQVNI